MKFPDILIRKPLPPQAELMEFPDIPTGDSPRRQLQGPRPTPLTISKDSLKIRKPLLPQAELMEFPDIPTGKSPRRQLLGPRPSPIRIQKDSHKIRKPPPPPLQPFIIYSVSPKVIHNPLSDFMSLDQYLTGSSSSASSFNMGSKDSFSCNQGDMVSPAARFAAIEKARSPQPKKVLIQHQSGEAGGDREVIVEVGDAVDGPNSTSHGILSPGPAALSPIPASFFSPPATADPSTQQTTPDHLLTDDRGAMENFRELLERSIFTQDHTNDKYVHSKEDGHAILHSVNTLSPLFMKKSGLGLTDPPKDEAWHSVVHMELANNKLSELPLSPSSPELRVLMLQGNADLTRVPNTFFSKMPLLTVLDLSHTSLRELPDSIFELEQLREMYLKGCERFMKLSPKIAKLQNLEKLDLDGTQIIHLPEEIRELTNLQSLFLCFYEYPGRKGKQYTRSTIIPSEVISKLKWLKRLSIDVNPDDERWYENVRDIIPEIFGLEHLQTLSLYIPHLELLKFIPDRILRDDFRLIVGRHMQRIISSTPSTIEATFKQCGSSLKFVNGEDVPDEIKRLVRVSKALFLERHKTIKHLSEFKMMNLEQLRVCMLAECREMQTIVDGRQSNRGNEIFSHLLYLYVSHMKSLKSIWEGVMPPRSLFSMLRSLVLQNCPELTTVFTMDFLGNLSLLKELIVKGCPKVTTLISDGSFRLGIFLPKMSKIMLLHLPELVTISNGCHIAPSLNAIAVYDCPKLQSLSKSELSSSTVKVIKGEIKWWDQLQWSKEEWGTSQRPTKFDRIFSSIDNQVDIMTQIGNAGDDIDDDADMAPPHTLFEDPKQNADSFSSAKKNAERFTFRTKSEVDVLDDGYKWRKYGVKTASSEYPRSYYRCTRAGCLVRKRVQRSTGDPTMIETVYEGIHTHPSPEENRSLHELQSMRSEEISSDSVVTARGLDVNSAPADVDDADDAAALSSPNSEISSFHMDFPVRNSHGSGGYKREHDGNADRPSDDDENGSTRKKLRLSKEQSAFLEESFKEHTKLNPKQKLALEKKLNLRPRQVEVWFQNRLARTKLKQREVDCEYLKRCCDTLTENRRLQKEVQELRALKTSQPYYMQLPATALTMCPSSERVVTKSSAAGTTSTATATSTCTSGASGIPVALSLGNGMLPFAKAQAQAQAHHTSS